MSFNMDVIIKFMSGDIHIIKIWNGFNMGNLLTKVTEIMETEIGEIDFNDERITFYNKYNERINFLDRDFLQNGEYFNVVIIDEEDIDYAYQGYFDDDNREID